MTGPDLNRLRDAARAVAASQASDTTPEPAEDKWWDPLCQMCTPNPLWIATGRVARIHAQERHREQGG